MHERVTFPNFLFMVLLFAVLTSSFYLLQPELTIGYLLLKALLLSAIVTIITTWALKYRLKLAEKRLLKKGLDGNATEEQLESKSKSIVQSYYILLFQVFIISIIVYYLHLGKPIDIPFWTYLAVIIMAAFIAELIGGLIFKFAGRKGREA